MVVPESCDFRYTKMYLNFCESHSLICPLNANQVLFVQILSLTYHPSIGPYFKQIYLIQVLPLLQVTITFQF